MPRVLVTGANGFLGRYAVSALAAEGWEVLGTGRLPPDLPDLADSMGGDLLKQSDRQILLDWAKADVLLHLAWLDDPRRRWHAPENVDWAAASLSFAHSFATCGGKRIVFASSCAVYDFAARNRHSENDTLRPTSLYGAAKAATANLLAAAAPAFGVSVAEARLFFCYGEGEPKGRLVPDLIGGIRRNEPVDCTDGKQRRDYLHAEDVGRALALICGSDVAGAVNVASGTSIGVADLVAEIAQQMGRPDLPRLGAIVRPAEDPDDIVADVSRLASLGFRPKLELRAGVELTVKGDAASYPAGNAE